jgi:general stress protein YciG
MQTFCEVDNTQKRCCKCNLQKEGVIMAGTSNRGFASMDAAKQREIASKGGKAAHQKGTAHQFTSEEARRAGSKGGRAARQKRAQLASKPPHLVLTKDEVGADSQSYSSVDESNVRESVTGQHNPDVSRNDSESPRDHVSNG